MSPLDAIEIPDKTYFKIGEVAKLLDLEPHVLRYWEGEFDMLAPDKSDSGQRIYQREDIELVVQIRHLLYEEMFTIAGARRQLELEREGQPCYFSSQKHDDDAAREQLEQLESENAQLRDKLEAVSAQLEEHKQAHQPELFEQQIAAQKRRIEELEGELDEARHIIGRLERQRDEARQTPSVDPRLLRDLREEVEDLAKIAEGPV